MHAAARVIGRDRSEGGFSLIEVVIAANPFRALDGAREDLVLGLRRREGAKVVLTEQQFVDPLQEHATFGALDDAVVVGARDRDDLADAQRSNGALVGALSTVTPWYCVTVLGGI